MTTAEATPATIRRFTQELKKGQHPEHFYVALLGLSAFDTVDLHERVEAGFSYAAFERIRQALDVPTSDVAELIWVTGRTLARRKQSRRLHPDESDRLLRLARILGLTLRLFEGDLDKTRRWLLSPNEALGNEAPLRMATTEVGAREVEHLIGRLEHGIPL